MLEERTDGLDHVGRLVRLEPDVAKHLAGPFGGFGRRRRHVLERVLLGGVGERIEASALPGELLEGDEAYLGPGAPARPTLEEVERRYIELTLAHARGNQTRAAAILGISRKALWEKRKRYGLR